MKSKNICKFISPSLPDNLMVSHFILESNPQIMRKQETLKTNRVILVVEGEGIFNIGKSEYNFSSGSLVFAFSGESFSAQFEGECEYMYIGFSGTRAEELFRRFDIRTKNRDFSGFDGLIPLWQESLSRADSQTIDLASESILLYTFSRLSGTNAQRGSLINKIIEISEEQFKDPELSIATIAKALSYNPKYLSHIFKEKMGIGYSEYLRTLRIKFAVSLFEHGIDSVKNVALLSGFSDPLYFSTVFKKTTGVSPKDYKVRKI